MARGLRIPQLPKLASSLPQALGRRATASFPAPHSLYSAPPSAPTRAFSTNPPRALRPGQSYDFPPQGIHPPASHPEDAAQPPPPPPPLPPPPRARRLPWGRMLTVAVFLALGGSAGLAVRNVLVPNVFPVPGTPADLKIIQQVRRRAAKEPIVQQLEADADWHEMERAMPYYVDGEAVRAGDGQRHLIQGALQGARGVGAYARTWLHSTEATSVTVVFFGPATAGWPSVVHGGVLAGMMADELGWLPLMQAGGASPGPTSLRDVDVKYNRSVRTERFHLITTYLVPPEATRSLDGGAPVRAAAGIWELSTVKDLKRPSSKALAEATSGWVLGKKTG